MAARAAGARGGDAADMAKRVAPQRLRAWLAVALCTALILTFSGEGFSAASTSRFVGPFVRWLFPDASPQTLEWVHFAIRKGAHAAEYGLLALLALRAELLASARIPHAAVARVLTLCVVVAGVDEVHQARLEQRTGSAGDVGIDLAGAVAALALALGIRRWSAERRRAPTAGAPRGEHQ